MRAKYPGACARCDRTYDVGAWITMRKGHWVCCGAGDEE